MTLAIYLKDPPKFRANKRNFYIEDKKRDRIFSLIITSIGLIAILFAVGPYLTWQLITIPRLQLKVSDIPIPQKQVLSQSAITEDIQIVKDPDGFSYFFTSQKPQGPRPKQFLLTVPKLEIYKAKVMVDDVRFDKYLSHFPGSAIPGEVGNSFITGHSVLPNFADPQNYKAIFTNLSSLEIGDEVFVEQDGRTLQFIVQYSKVVDPKDISVLAPISSTGRNLTLMTCVPPGTNLKRLVVITGLI